MAPDLPGLVQQIAHFENRLAADPGSRVFLPLADLYRRAGRLDDARRILERGLDRHPAFVTARAALGLVLSQLGEASAAREQLAAVVARDPDNLLALRLLARLAGEAQRWTEACEHFERLLRLEPENREVRDGLRAARGRLDEAPAHRADDGAAASDLGPMTPRSVAATASGNAGFETPTLAELYLRQGHPGKARVIVERILAQDPGREDARQVLARIEAGENGEDPGDGDGVAPSKATTGSDAGESTAAVDDAGESAAATPPAPQRAAVPPAPPIRGDDLDRFRAWLDAASDPRGPAS